MISDDAGRPGSREAIQRITHELRTPLTVVIGFCELLTSDRPDDASVKEFAARISANAWLLQAAVERLIEELQSADYAGPANDPRFLGNQFINKPVAVGADAIVAVDPSFPGEPDDRRSAASADPLAAP
ncbi:MAG: hypothetical protein M3464_01845 [Chloroflexota bacterium]|nr:hypothetical protein [Chloroflexota bacterium]